MASVRKDDRMKGPRKIGLFICEKKLTKEEP